MSRTLLNLIKTEPAMIAAVVQAVIGLSAAVGLNLTAAQTGSILAATTAMLAVVPAVLARPIKVTAFTGVLSSVVTVLVAFGVRDIQPGFVTSANAVIVAVMAIVLWGHLTPNALAKARAAAAAPRPAS